MITTTQTITRLSTTVETDEGGLWFTSEINDMMITFEGNYYDGYLDLLFTVDGTLERVELSKKEKLAISRWLLACWNIALTKYDKFSCCATDDDGTGWRAAMYTKIGFKQVNDYMVYVK